MKKITIIFLMISPYLNTTCCEHKILEFRLQTFNSSLEKLISDFLPQYPQEIKIEEMLEYKIKEIRSLDSEKLAILSFDDFLNQYPEEQNLLLMINNKDVYILTDDSNFIPFKITDNCKLLLFQLKTGKYTYFF